MILIDPKEPHEFRPQADGVCYQLKVPTVADRVRYKREIRLAGARQWAETHMLDALADGLREIMAASDPQLVELLGEIATARGRWETFYADIRDGQLVTGDSQLSERLRELDLPGRLRAAELVVMDHYPRYSTMISDRELYGEIAATVATRLFVLGWDVPDAEPYRHGAAQLPDAQLARIPLAHMMAIAKELGRLMDPDPELLGNSASLSGERSGLAASNGTGTRPRSDRSRATAGHVQSSASPS